MRVYNLELTRPKQSEKILYVDEVLCDSPAINNCLITVFKDEKLVGFVGLDDEELFTIYISSTRNLLGDDNLFDLLKEGKELYNFTYKVQPKINLVAKKLRKK